MSTRRMPTPARLLAGLALSGLLTACGGWWDDDGSTTGASVELSGVAATGAAIAHATVTVVDAQGEQATARTGADGRYTVQVSESAPYILSVVDGAGKTWYSYAAAAGTAHITPLTTLALLDANADKPLADLMSAWRRAPLSAAQVLEGAKPERATDDRGLCQDAPRSRRQAIEPGLDDVLNCRREIQLSESLGVQHPRILAMNLDHSGVDQEVEHLGDPEGISLAPLDEVTDEGRGDFRHIPQTIPDQLLGMTRRERAYIDPVVDTVPCRHRRPRVTYEPRGS